MVKSEPAFCIIQKWIDVTTNMLSIHVIDISLAKNGANLLLKIRNIVSQHIFIIIRFELYEKQSLNRICPLHAQNTFGKT